MTHYFKALYFPLRLSIFYLIFINLWRLLFIVFNTVDDWKRPFIQAIRLDVSMICYLLLIIYVPWFIYLITGNDIVKKIIKWIVVFTWFLVCIVELSSVLIFPEWGTSLNFRALSYLQHPDEAWASVYDFINIYVSLTGLLLLFWGWKKLRTLFNDWQPVRSYYAQSYIFAGILLPVIVIGMRGGLQKLPLKPSDAFYSADMKNNFAAVNKSWYLLYSISKHASLSYVNQEVDIKNFTKEYLSQPCRLDSISSHWTGKNIVFITMEGWSYNMVKYLGSGENITPSFDSLGEVSTRFIHAYSSGFRTDQGLLSILSGIPSVGGFNMANHPEKVKLYPSVVRALKSKGYSSSFIYGGDLNFSNLNTYLLHSGFDQIISEKDFDLSQRATDWGVPDHITAEKAAGIMKSNTKFPFFSAVLFLSSHSPFDTPIKNEFSDTQDIPSKYKASVKYSDLALGIFFEKIKDAPWFKNTVFVITSDHGSHHAINKEEPEYQKFRIPFIIYDPSSQSVGNQIDIPVNHFDLPFTICKHLAISTEAFSFGRNIYCDNNTKAAFWSSDHNNGIFINAENKSFNSNEKKTPGSLFQDMVKMWFNNLDAQ